MPILFSVITAAVVLVIQLSVGGFFSQMTRTDQKTRDRFNRAELALEIAPKIREAIARYAHDGGCPSTMARQPLSTTQGTVQSCWPRGGGGGSANMCIQSANRDLHICITSGRDVGMNKWAELLIPTAQATVTIPSKTPVTGGYGGRGVSIERQQCGGTNAPCIMCNGPRTTCVTVRFCISTTARTTCPVSDQLTQTFAFRDIKGL